MPRETPTLAPGFHVGVAGWDYPDWNGIVYPAGAARRLDRLAWIARFVDLVEVNATFYRPIPARRAQDWVRRTRERPEFRFSAKAHRSWTHDDGVDLDRAVADTLAGLAPLRDAGRLLAILIQFPHRVHAGRDAMRRIETLAERSAGWPRVVEVRHRSWSDPAALRRLADLGLGWCVVDQPDLPGTVGVVESVSGPCAYVRLHGRNRATWFDPEAGRDRRYDYRYGADEIDGLVQVARRLRARAEHVAVVHNNHFRGQAMVNALQVRRRLFDRRVAAPAALVQSYPDLADDVVLDQERLF